jgi:hypothetical protein
MVIKKPCGPEVPVVSVTVTRKVYVPAVVGVPEITPVAALKLNPGGGEPLVIVQLHGHVSGAASKVAV